MSEVAVRRHPPWLKVRAPGGAGFAATLATMNELRLHTVCQEARCPNLGECWANKTATLTPGWMLIDTRTGKQVSADQHWGDSSFFVRAAATTPCPLNRRFSSQITA